MSMIAMTIQVTTHPVPHLSNPGSADSPLPENRPVAKLPSLNRQRWTTHRSRSNFNWRFQ